MQPFCLDFYFFSYQFLSNHRYYMCFLLDFVCSFIRSLCACMLHGTVIGKTALHLNICTFSKLLMYALDVIKAKGEMLESRLAFLAETMFVT
uniref:Uncharacterized protein n=1 Tax=Rhizophora mucronata TaxID=61149 RepID=A0A2P2N1L2_RHIMU